MRENAIRRFFLRRVLKIVIFGLVLLLLFYGLAARSGRVVVERVEVPLPGLPAVGAVCYCFPHVSTFRTIRLMAVTPRLGISSTESYKKYPLRFFLLYVTFRKIR